MTAPQSAAARRCLTWPTVAPGLTEGMTHSLPAETMTLTAAPVPSFVPVPGLRASTPPRPTLELAE